MSELLETRGIVIVEWFASAYVKRDCVGALYCTEAYSFMTYQPIHGVICPAVTPLKPDGDINRDMIRPLVDFLIDKGVAGIYPLGTTGEGPLFTTDERKAVAEATVDAVAGRVPVIIHTGAITTGETIALTRHAQSVGADAASVITPWYFPLDDAALEAHYGAIYEAVPDFPVYLYNLPAMAQNSLSAALVTRLARRYENCVGLKDSSGDLGTMFATNHLQEGRFNTCIGPDGLILAGLSMGLDATVSGSLNYIPEIIVGLYRSINAGDLVRARQLQGQQQAVSEVVAGGGWLPVVKGIMAERGLPVGGVRAPLQSAPDEAVRACIAQLRALKVELSRA